MRKINEMNESGTADSRWQGIYKLGGLTALIIALLLVGEIAVYAVFPRPSTVTEHFALFRDNWLAGLMIEFLFTHPNYAAIGLPKYPLSNDEKKNYLHAPHVDMSCVLFRKEILDKITFVEPRKQEPWHPSDGRCECAACCWDIRQMGLEIGFLPGFQAEHIENTKAQHGTF